ncbi:MAG: KamA family radical SAM protein [Candidatus Omnitrophica bacterium]|nr:KamA family radical SAM protein [Candidatus Omnitrophota bacterium]MDD5488284.1 KamA family radical SAM protein [Candidatus Omnitrophota bacterium]
MEKETGLCLAAEMDEPPGTLCEAATSTWQDEDANSIKNIDDLSRNIPLLKGRKETLRKVAKLFHLRIPKYYLSLIKNIEDTKDPIYMQCVPSPEEIKYSEHDKMDPLGEVKTEATRYLIHRYPDRALLLVTGRCFMYCRHCTRKRLWRCAVAEPSLEDIDEALNYVRENEQIREIIVSGGDPLTLSTEKIEHILSAVSAISTIEVVRIGTRAPVVLPNRIDSELCAVFSKYPKLWINVQFNHPREVTGEATEACRRIQMTGVPMSNQSVLLKGINDDPGVMTELCHKLQSIRVRPYYLFQCDPVVGAAHFRTSVFKGMEIMDSMRGHTSGMCLPTFVVDGVDGKGKIPIAPNYIVSVTDKSLFLRNYAKEVFEYHNPA